MSLNGSMVPATVAREGELAVAAVEARADTDLADGPPESDTTPRHVELVP